MSDNKLSVFLVDDDQIYLKSLGHNLNEKLGRKITTASFPTGEACMAAMDQNPDLIILDYYLNSKEKDAQDGITVLKQLKKSHPNVNIVMLSGQDKIEVAVDSMKFGAIDYIVKSEGAMVRAETVIKNVLANRKQAELLKLYKSGFYIVSVILALILITTALLYLVFPDLVRYNP